eukprot:scaffold2395_cov290-Prasinococcus_capsulatus_cf.AAC.3
MRWLWILAVACLQTLYGDRRHYVLHYFLADDTVEILEVNEPNSGRDAFPVMLKRSKLPRVSESSDVCDSSYASPLGGGAVTSSTMECVTAADLHVGKTLKVYNRDFLLHDCDQFTASYYMQRYGRTFQPLDVSEPAPATPVVALPPYNGFGSDADSLQNCLSLIPKPVRKDFHKHMQNEKKVLRYIARLVDDPEPRAARLSPADYGRRFILQFFLADDTLAIFEPPERNSGELSPRPAPCRTPRVPHSARVGGIIGGKFLERRSVRKPSVNGQDGQQLSHYAARDLRTGAKLHVAGRLFELLEADEFSYAYMEAQPKVFPHSDFECVLAKVKKHVQGTRAACDGPCSVLVHPRMACRTAHRAEATGGTAPASAQLREQLRAKYGARGATDGDTSVGVLRQLEDLRHVLHEATGVVDLSLQELVTLARRSGAVDKEASVVSIGRILDVLQV